MKAALLEVAVLTVAVPLVDAVAWELELKAVVTAPLCRVVVAIELEARGSDASAEAAAVEVADHHTVVE